MLFVYKVTHYNLYIYMFIYCASSTLSQLLNSYTNLGDQKQVSDVFVMTTIRIDDCCIRVF